MRPVYTGTKSAPVYTGCVPGFSDQHNIQGGPTKVKPTTILLVTFECIGKIQ